MYDIINIYYTRYISLVINECLIVHIVTIIVWVDSAVTSIGMSSWHRRHWLTLDCFARCRCLFDLFHVAFRLSGEVIVWTFWREFVAHEGLAHGGLWSHSVFGLDELATVSYKYSVSYLHLVTSRSH